MSPIVSASQRCSVVVTVSRMLMGAGLRGCRPGVKGDPAQRPRHQPLARELARCRWWPCGRGICWHQLAALGRVLSLPPSLYKQPAVVLRYARVLQ
jgi:hypothetical protein